jgi:hypothetical protein
MNQKFTWAEDRDETSDTIDSMDSLGEMSHLYDITCSICHYEYIACVVDLR